MVSLTSGAGNQDNHNPVKVTATGEYIGLSLPCSGLSRAELAILSALAELEDASEHVRQRALKNVRVYIDIISKGMSVDSFAQVMDAVCNQLYLLLGSDNPNTVLGVISAIDCLVCLQAVGDLHEDSWRNCCNRFGSFLRIILQNQCNFILPARYQEPMTDDGVWSLIIVSKSCAVLARVAREGMRWRLSPAALIDYDMKRAFEWLIQKKGSDFSEDCKINKSKRLAAVLLLKEFAQFVPSFMHAHLSRFFSHIWVAIQDDEYNIIRLAGVEALTAVLLLLSRRDSLPKRVIYYTLVWRQIKKWLPAVPSRKSASPIQLNAWHGSLLALGELLDKRNGSDGFMWPRFVVILGTVVSFFKVNYDEYVFSSVTQILPKLAQLEPNRFCENGNLKKCLGFLLEHLELSSSKSESTVKGTIDPSLVLNSIGDLALAVGQRMGEFTQEILPSVFSFLGQPQETHHNVTWLCNCSAEVLKLFRNQVPQSSIQKATLHRSFQSVGYSALCCTINLVKAGGSSMMSYVYALVERVFEGGLSEGLFFAVCQLAETFPLAIPVIQSKILGGLSSLVCGSDGKDGTGSNSQEIVRLALVAVGQSSNSTFLNEMLMNRDKGGSDYSLGRLGVENLEENCFILDWILRYVEVAESSFLRQQAALTAIQILLPKPKILTKEIEKGPTDFGKKEVSPFDDEAFHFCFPSALHEVTSKQRRGRMCIGKSYKFNRARFSLIQGAVSRLLDFSVSAADPVARSAILDAFTSKFDPFICAPACVTALAKSLHDEDLRVRRSGLKVFARLAIKNQGTLLQGLNQMLIEFVTTLKYVSCWITQDATAQLLGDLIEHSSSVIVPYAPTLLSYFMRKLKEAYLELSSNSSVYAAQSTTPSARNLTSNAAWPLTTGWGTDPVANASTAMESSTLSPLSASEPNRGYRSSPNNSNRKDGIDGENDWRGNALKSTAKTLLRGVVALCNIMSRQELAGVSDEIITVLMEPLVSDLSGSSLMTDVVLALAAVWGNSCRPVQPYRDFPFLLPFFLQIVQSQAHSRELRHAVLRCIGVLGALDPDEYQTLESQTSVASKPSLLYSKTTRFALPSSMAEGWSNEDAIHGINQIHLDSLDMEGQMERPVRYYLMKQAAISTKQGVATHKRKKKFSIESAESVEDPRRKFPATESDGDDRSVEVEDSCSSEEEEGIDFFSRHAVVSLLRLLSDPPHPGVIRFVATQSLLSVLKSLGSKSVEFASLALPAVLNLSLSTPDAADRAHLLTYTAQLISVLKRLGATVKKKAVAILSTLLDDLLASQRTNAQQFPVHRALSHSTIDHRPQRSLSRFRAYGSRSFVPSPRPSYGESNRLRPAATEAQTTSSAWQSAVVWKRPESAEVCYGHCIIPKLVSLIKGDNSRDRQISTTVLQTLQSLGPSLNEHIYLIIPPLLTVFEHPSTNNRFKLQLLDFIRRVLVFADLSLLLSRIIHPFQRCLQDPNQSIEIKKSIFTTLKILNELYPLDLKPFMNSIRSTVLENRLAAPPPFQSSDQVFSSLTRSQVDFDASRQENQMPPGSKINRWRSLSNVSTSKNQLLFLPSEQSESGRITNDGGSKTSTHNTLSEFIKLDEATTSCRPHSKSTGDVNHVFRSDQVRFESSHSGLSTRGGATGPLWVNEENLQQVWSSCTCSSPEEYAYWFRRLTLEMTRESSSLAIRECAPVVQYGAGQSFIKEIFPAAFLSCWMYLSDKRKLQLAEVLAKAVSSPQIGLSESYQVLSLVEVLGKQGEIIPINTDVLIRVAERCNAHAKALGYRELEWLTFPETAVEPLIALYDSLGHQDAAVGVLNYARKYLNINLNDSWTEKLQRWDDALFLYTIHQLDQPDSIEWLKGRMRCLYALGDWDRLSQIAAAVWDQDARLRFPRQRVEIAAIAVANELNLKNFPRMAIYARHLEGGQHRRRRHDKLDNQNRISLLNQTSLELEEEEEDENEFDGGGSSFESAFFQAILKINNEEYSTANKLIQKARGFVEIELTALLGESYTRAYQTLIKVQQLTELEEVIAFQCCDINSTKKDEIKQLWSQRLLEGCKPDTDIWHSILQVRSIVLPPHKDIDVWLKYASLSRQQGRLGIASRVVEEIRRDVKASQDPRVFAAYTKNLYANGETTKALSLLKSFCQTFSAVAGLEPTKKLETLNLADALSLFEVAQHFPVTELLHLSQQVKLLGDQVPPCHTLMQTTIVKVLKKADLYFPPIADIPMAHFSSLGLMPYDVGLLLASCHLKLARWSQSVNATTVVGPPITRYLVADVTDQQIMNGELLGGWCAQRPTLLMESCMHLRTAIKCCPALHKVWKFWAEFNFQLCQAYDQSRGCGRTATSQRPKAATSSQEAASAAAMALEICPVLAQLEEEKEKLDRLWKCTLCHSHSHEESVPSMRTHSASSLYRLNKRRYGMTGSRYRAKRSWTIAEAKEKEVIFKTIERYGRSFSFQARQHLGFVVDAAGGFVRSIALRPRAQDIQDLLRLLTVWFRHAEVPELNVVLKEAFSDLPTQTWIPVIPQILARLKTQNCNLRGTVRHLLRRVSENYPEALVFPVMAAASTFSFGQNQKCLVPLQDEEAGQSEATELLQSIALRFPVLVAQSRLVSNELIRISILQPEQWHETLEECSRLYYTDKNIPLMIKTLIDLYKESDSGFHTFNDLNFAQSYSRELGIAYLYLRRFIDSNQSYATMFDFPPPIETSRHIQWNHIHDLDQAWQTFYEVYSSLWKQIRKMAYLDLQYVSPKLKTVTNLEIAVPGRYNPIGPYAKIVAFDGSVSVFPTKQRPRKIHMYGSDGREYPFLVKGHEDLRQDERVMQVLHLINRLFMSESLRAYQSKLRLQSNSKNYDQKDLKLKPGDGTSGSQIATPDLAIPVYSVVPLSTDSGLIEWVPGTDTLHSLVKKYRELHDISLSIEHDLLKSMYPKYEELTLLQKVEVFRMVLDSTSGDDLRHILWQSSRNSEVWLQRRSNFTLSLAMMSVCGYVLGLGDRHPSNLMIMRSSGRVIHIDFGDCFEVAALRDRFPETIPFRLTRMLLNGMEIGCLEGRFRLTCERVLRSLRANRDAVVATLETFLYDPLMTWRLLVPQHKKLERLLKASALSKPILNQVQTEIHTASRQLKRRSGETISETAMLCLVCRRHRNRVQSRIRRRCTSRAALPFYRKFEEYSPMIRSTLPYRRPSFARHRSISSVAATEVFRLRSAYTSRSGSHRPAGHLLLSEATPFDFSIDDVSWPNNDLKLKLESDCVNGSIEDEWETHSATESCDTMTTKSCRSAFTKSSHRRAKLNSISSRLSIDSTFRTHLDGIPFFSQSRKPRLCGSTTNFASQQSSAIRLIKRNAKLLNQTGDVPRLIEPETKDVSGTDPVLLSKVAEMVLQRIETKLSGADFGRDRLNVSAQVERLIKEATSIQNLAQCFVGWCAFW